MVLTPDVRSALLYCQFAKQYSNALLTSETCEALRSLLSPELSMLPLSKITRHFPLNPDRVGSGHLAGYRLGSELQAVSSL